MTEEALSGYQARLVRVEEQLTRLQSEVAELKWILAG